MSLALHPMIFDDDGRSKLEMSHGVGGLHHSRCIAKVKG